MDQNVRSDLEQHKVGVIDRMQNNTHLKGSAVTVCDLWSQRQSIGFELN